MTDILSEVVPSYEIIAVAVQGPAGPGITVSVATPQPLGVAAVGTSLAYTREDHVHAMPSAAAVGADAAGAAAAAQAAAATDATTKANAAQAAAIAASEPVNANIQAHIASSSNPHSVTKTQVGLGNCDNTSDANKPVSTAQASADAAVLASAAADATSKANAAQAASQPLDSDLTAIAALAPSNDDVVQRKAGAWTNRTMAQVKTDLVLVKGDVGLGNIDNTSDANKPVSTAQAAADAAVASAAASDATTKANAAQAAAIAASQPVDTELTALAGLTSAADKLPYFTGAGTAGLADFTAAGRALLDDADATAQRATLGLGTAATMASTAFDAAGAAAAAQAASQPLDATLTALAGLTIAADSLSVGTGADAFTQTSFAANTFPAKASTGGLVAKPITDFGLSLVDDASASDARTTLGLGSAAVLASTAFDAAGSAAAAQAASQPLDATLSALAALVIAASSLCIGTGADAFAQTTFAANTFPARASSGALVAKAITDFGLSLVDDADAAAARTTLGLGSLATQSGTFSGTSSGTNTGDQTNISGNAATVTTNANLTGAITSTGNATSLGSFTSAALAAALTDETGSGVAVFATSPVLVTPNIGSASATSLAIGGTLAGLVSVCSDTTALGQAYFCQASADTDAFDLNIRKSRGTVASPTVITVGDDIGRINFWGCDAAGTYALGAVIKAVSFATGTVASTRMPTQLEFAVGSDAAPSVYTTCLTLRPNLYPLFSNGFDVGASATPKVRIDIGQPGVSLATEAIVTWGSSSALNAKQLVLSKAATGVLAVGAAGTGGSFDGTVKAASYIVGGTSGSLWERGYLTELITLSTSGTTTDSSADLLPANCIIEAVCGRVTTTITTATDWKMGDPTTAGRFTAANATMTANTTDIGTLHADQTGAAGPRQVAAAKLRITTTGTPGAGVVRVTTFWRKFTAPTS